MSIFKKTGLGRPMDFRLLSNRLAFILPVVAGAISLVWDFVVNDSFAIGEAMRAGIAVFLAWAIGREVDPDREWVAYAAMAFALVLSIAHSPNLIVSAAALVGVRALVGTVDKPLTNIDRAVLVVGAGLASLDPVGWPVSALIAVAILVTGGPAAGWWAAAAGAVSIVIALVASEGLANQLAPGYLASLAFVTLAGIVSRVGYVRTVSDVSKQPLNRFRLRAGRVAIALTVTFAAFVSGPVGIALVGPLAAATVPAAVAPLSLRR